MSSLLLVCALAAAGAESPAPPAEDPSRKEPKVVVKSFVISRDGDAELLDDQGVAWIDAGKGPMQLVDMLGADPNAKAAAAEAEKRVADENGLQTVGLPGPDGAVWLVHYTELEILATELLRADGHSLTDEGLTRVEEFVKGSVLAAREWVLADDAGPGALAVEVGREMPGGGPPLSDSLKGATMPSKPAITSG